MAANMAQQSGMPSQETPVDTHNFFTHSVLLIQLPN